MDCWFYILRNMETMREMPFKDRKKIFSKVDFHLNATEKSLTVKYGENIVILRICEDGGLKLETNLSLAGSAMEI